MSEPLTADEIVVTAPQLVGHPRAAALIDGALVPGLLGFRSDENEFSSPDHWSVSWAMEALPAAHDAGWFAQVARGAELEIRCGKVADPASYSAADLPQIIVGRIDDIDFDWVDGVVTATGRDLTGALCDSKTSEKYINRTASSVAEALAAKHGLDADVTATSAKVGTLYKADHVDLQSERTEWDLLTWLARESGFVTYIAGRTLYFGPRASEDDAAPFVIRREAVADAVTKGNYARLGTTRTLTVSGEISVTVRSWSTNRKAVTSKTARRAGGGGAAQAYSYSIPGLTPDQARSRAEQILADLSAHAMKLSYEGPGFALKISDLIRLEGTGTAFDALYYPEAISREFSVSDGYTINLSAKNHPTEDQGSL